MIKILINASPSLLQSASVVRQAIYDKLESIGIEIDRKKDTLNAISLSWFHLELPDEDSLNLAVLAGILHPREKLWQEYDQKRYYWVDTCDLDDSFRTRWNRMVKK